MIAVVTGDIVNSRQAAAEDWLYVLKESLQLYGSHTQDWEIFRGDSFQLRLEPQLSLKASLQIKAAIKQKKDLDVRLAIGIGEEDYQGNSISESNGSAYVRSGVCFEDLKKQLMGISTGNKSKDEILNLFFSLALLTMNSWSPTVAATVSSFLQHPEKSQTEMAGILGKSQSSLSEALKRGGYEEIMQLETYYRKEIMDL
ncbi:transcriptional regulator [Salinimicrobium sp. CAU 1759]